MYIDPSLRRRCNSSDETLLRSILAENGIKKPQFQTRNDSASGNSPSVEGKPCCMTNTENGVFNKSLGMVYSPLQCWQKLYDAEIGLSKGTIFAELDLPFEATSKGGKCGG